jgi:hypothetical protein
LDGKHIEYGRRRSVDVAGAACPGQKIETVDEALRARLSPPARPPRGSCPPTMHDDFRNRLIWGDKKLVRRLCLKSSGAR